MHAYLEENNILTPTQTGLWLQRSTEQQLIYFAPKVENGMQEKKKNNCCIFWHDEGFSHGMEAGITIQADTTWFQWIKNLLEDRIARR